VDELPPNVVSISRHRQWRNREILVKERLTPPPSGKPAPPVSPASTVEPPRRLLRDFTMLLQDFNREQYEQRNILRELVDCVVHLKLSIDKLTGRIK
jgi:hypothetical protein